MVLTAQPGPLASTTVLRIQPFNNLAHGNGGGLRTEPEGQNFLKPVTLTFSYSVKTCKGRC